MQKRIYILLLISLIIFGCCSMLGPVCNEPYIYHDKGCCLDKNANEICDSDESFTCWDGSVVKDEATCPPEPFTCADGSVVTNSSLCPKKIRCWDNSTVYNASKCPDYWVEAPGWYACNDRTSQPCKSYKEAYCSKFTPTDVNVREAASQAIKKHPGAFSLNQLLDVYDWVHTNVIYQNVPVNLTYQPYSPADTLRTGSGDCKNQAVLIASMVEAIGGSARVLLIPDCQHAFAEVYVGNDSAEVDTLNKAIRAHYPSASGETITWHTAKNETEYWFIFDTAAGAFPGQTIEECFDAEQTFVMYDCETQGILNPPEVFGTEYGPYTIINDSQIIQPDGYSYYHWIDPILIPDTYTWCRYKITVSTPSKGYIDWYITDETGYQNYRNYAGFSYYYGEEQVPRGEYSFDWDKPERFYVIAYNNNRDYSLTLKTEIIETCYND
jgi:hypothetical protein